MDKTGSVESRVVLFEALGRAFVERSAEELGAKDPERRGRALRALADLAFVSCAVADSAGQTAGAVRRRVAKVAELVEPAARGPRALVPVAEGALATQRDDAEPGELDELEIGGGD